jgi:hypothetical protein
MTALTDRLSQEAETHYNEESRITSDQPENNGNPRRLHSVQ